MSRGYVALVLHAHLPFVKHPEYADFLEEDWFNEAAVETYLPLLDMMERLNT
jgi:1,4-alpha-glucan branching enzyme